MKRIGDVGVVRLNPSVPKPYQGLMIVIAMMFKLENLFSGLERLLHHVPIKHTRAMHRKSPGCLDVIENRLNTNPMF